MHKNYKLHPHGQLFWSIQSSNSTVPGFSVEMESKPQLKETGRSFRFPSKPPHHLFIAWLPCCLVGSSLDILLASKHAHQAREDVPVHNSLRKWLNVSGNVHPHVQDRLVRRAEVRRTGLRQDLCALGQVVDVEDPQQAQPHIFTGVVLWLRSVWSFLGDMPDA